MELFWSKCARGEWSLLEEVDPDSLHEYGVFVVWRNGGDAARPSAVLYVGHGNLRHEVARCQRDPLFHGSREVRVTWAKVADLRDLKSVAAYLYHRLHPMWGEVVLAGPQQPVNLPLTA